MGRRERAVFGGLLSGVGEGMLLQSSNRQKEEIANRKAIIDSLKEGRQHERQSGLLANTQVDEFGNVKGITRGGDVTDLGFKAAPASGDSGRSAGDKRLIDEAKDRYTTESFEGTVIDWKGVDAYLAAQGRPDLAAPRSTSVDTSIDKNSDAWLSAQGDAEKWGKDQERFWSFDTTVFEPYGGETQAIRDKTMEYYLADKGVAANVSSAGRTKPGDSGVKSATSGTKPIGSGTQKDPYRGTNQADIEWFKTSAPAGSIIEVDGTLYEK